MSLEAPLVTSLGELVAVQIRVEPRSLEDLLDVLTQVSFPINPEIRHQPGPAVVEFPLFSSQVEEVATVIQPLNVSWEVYPIMY